MANMDEIYPILAGCLATAIAISSFSFTWMICIWCKTKKKEPEDPEKPTLADSKAGKPIEDPKQSEAVKEVKLESEKAEPKEEAIIPDILKKPTPRVVGTSDKKYYEIGEDKNDLQSLGLAKQKYFELDFPGQAKPVERMPPPKAGIARGTPAYATLQLVDRDNFEASKIGNKSGAAMLSARPNPSLQPRQRNPTMRPTGSFRPKAPTIAPDYAPKKTALYLAEPPEPPKAPKPRGTVYAPEPGVPKPGSPKGRSAPVASRIL